MTCGQITDVKKGFSHILKFQMFQVYNKQETDVHGIPQQQLDYRAGKEGWLIRVVFVRQVILQIQYSKDMEVSNGVPPQIIQVKDDHHLVLNQQMV